MATYIAHGDVALSVLMTTASTVGAIFMTPLLTKLLAGALVPVDAAVSKGMTRSRCSLIIGQELHINDIAASQVFGRIFACLRQGCQVLQAYQDCSVTASVALP